MLKNSSAELRDVLKDVFFPAQFDASGNRGGAETKASRRRIFSCLLIVCAGMEGALPSVVGGMVDTPVIAVPTSVGYGANFPGLAVLLGMLNSSAT